MEIGDKVTVWWQDNGIGGYWLHGILRSRHRGMGVVEIHSSEHKKDNLDVPNTVKQFFFDPTGFGDVPHIRQGWIYE